MEESYQDIDVKASKLGVKMWDSPLRYYVDSSSNPMIGYLVELKSPLRYKCSCEGFQFKRKDKDGFCSIQRNPCRHVRLVCEYVKWMSLKNLIEMYDK